MSSALPNSQPTSQPTPKRGRNVLVLGSGGREHAIAWAVAKSPRCTGLAVAPGNAGTPGRRCDVNVEDPTAVVALAKSLNTDLVIIGPETALAAGVSDALRSVGIDVFGPSQAAAQLETSKIFSRQFCERHSMPVPASRAFSADQVDEAIAWVKNGGVPMVVKADGLAAGKGVVVPGSVDETIDAIRSALTGGTFGTAGHSVLIEELLVGDEVSLLAFCDGAIAIPMPPAQDHKRIYEGDRGPNTGGMGAYAPAPVCPPELVKELTQMFLQKAIDGCRAEGFPFSGVLYAGLMLTASGPKLIEFNARFGDPETQAIMPLLTGDLIDIAEACAIGGLSAEMVTWSQDSSCAVVIASPGYPVAAQTGSVVSFAARHPESEAILFHAGTVSTDGVVKTAGGRVIVATGIGKDFTEARTRAYNAAGDIAFDGMQVRRDIGWRAIARSTGGYAASGVSIDEGNRAVDLLKASVSKTQGASVLAGVGGFGGVFDVSALKKLDHPVLVASTDGVGTKVALAAQAGRLRGVGIDLVNHCVNDVLVQNARPMFFLDYIASSKIIPEEVAEIVTGMSEACLLNECALLGGETAEMPGVYHDGHVDVAGTLVGAADRDQLLPRTTIAEGDVLVAIHSSGPHTSGYSLLRRMFAGIPLDAMPAPLEVSLGDALLEPHRSYLPVLKDLLDGPSFSKVKGLIHITGGGLQENIPRILPDGLGVDIVLGSWPVPPLFQLIRDVSGLDAHELHRTLNMGIGMIVVCAQSDAPTIQSAIAEPTWIVGMVVQRAGSEVHLI
jgi:phosphoribosylamine--glycine ligase/phosphoribosylaminoimidazole synthetase